MSVKQRVYLFLVAISNRICFAFVKIIFFLHPHIIKSLSEKVINVGINTGKPDDIEIVDDYNFWITAASGSRFGLAKSFVNGYFECEQLDELLLKIIRSKYLTFLRYHPYAAMRNFLYNAFDTRIGSNVWEMGGKHYDIDIDFYKCFLGPTMKYSCGYWETATDLDSAQIESMRLIARKLHLKPGMKVLDIGCGYGSLAKFLATNYGVTVVGITVSNDHANYAKENCDESTVEIRVQDYRDVDEPFDRIIAVEMIEHIGPKNYRNFFKALRRNLNDDGFVLIHCMGMNHTYFEAYDLFLNDHIYLNMHFPLKEQIAKASCDLLFIEDWHILRNDFSPTMKAWMQNFNDSWPSLEKTYGEQFRRLWMYYLSAGAAAFKGRRMQVWHIVFSKNGIVSGYDSQR